MPPALSSTAQLGRMQPLTALTLVPAAPEPALPGGPAAVHLYIFIAIIFKY